MNLPTLTTKYIVSVTLRDGFKRCGFEFWKKEDLDKFINSLYFMKNYRSYDIVEEPLE